MLFEPSQVAVTFCSSLHVGLTFVPHLPILHLLQYLPVWGAGTQRLEVRHPIRNGSTAQLKTVEAKDVVCTHRTQCQQSERGGLDVVEVLCLFVQNYRSADGLLCRYAVETAAKHRHAKCQSRSFLRHRTLQIGQAVLAFWARSVLQRHQRDCSGQRIGTEFFAQHLRIAVVPAPVPTHALVKQRLRFDNRGLESANRRIQGLGCRAKESNTNLPALLQT